MNEIINIANKERCQFCKKRLATKQCDMPIYIGRTIGHPPRVNGKYVPIPEYATCDKYMCDECSAHIDDEVDICPSCISKIKSSVKERLD